MNKIVLSIIAGIIVIIGFIGILFSQTQEVQEIPTQTILNEDTINDVSKTNWHDVDGYDNLVAWLEDMTEIKSRYKNLDVETIEFYGSFLTQEEKDSIIALANQIQNAESISQINGYVFSLESLTANAANKKEEAESKRNNFISEWGSRINNYLAGSPLAGYGPVFAEAAYNYNVDPRWSPAISCIESGKGVSCFRSHNAWGWGSSSWNNWETAIHAHVKGLSEGYGYTISESAARKYCPPTAGQWYSKVSAEMNKI